MGRPTVLDDLEPRLTYPKARPAYSDAVPFYIIIGVMACAMFLIGLVQSGPSHRVLYVLLIAAGSALVTFGIVTWYRAQLSKYPPPPGPEASVMKSETSAPGNSVGPGMAFATGVAGPIVAGAVVGSSVGAIAVVVFFVAVIAALACGTHFRVSGRKYP